MNPSEPDPAPQTLAQTTFVVLGATLALMAIVPVSMENAIDEVAGSAPLAAQARWP